MICSSFTLDLQQIFELSEASEDEIIIALVEWRHIQCAKIISLTIILTSMCADQQHYYK